MTDRQRALEYSHELHKFASHMRGEFLNGATWIEVILSDILGRYFCASEKRRNLFFSEIGNKMTFSRKVALFEQIILGEFSDFEKTCPDFKRRLDAFLEFRNVLAHSHIDTSRPTLAKRKPNEVTFIIYKRGKVVGRRVTAAEGERRAKDINALRPLLIKFQEMLLSKD
jgi:hypothetical protein